MTEEEELNQIEEESVGEEWTPKHAHKKHIKKWPKPLMPRTLHMNSVLAPKALKIIRKPFCPYTTLDCRHKFRERCSRKWENGREPPYAKFKRCVSFKRRPPKEGGC